MIKQTSLEMLVESGIAKYEPESGTTAFKDEMFCKSKELVCHDKSLGTFAWPPLDPVPCQRRFTILFNQEATIFIHQSKEEATSNPWEISPSVPSLEPKPLRPQGRPVYWRYICSQSTPGVPAASVEAIPIFTYFFYCPYAIILAIVALAQQVFLEESSFLNSMLLLIDIIIYMFKLPYIAVNEHILAGPPGT